MVRLSGKNVACPRFVLRSLRAFAGFLATAGIAVSAGPVRSAPVVDPFLDRVADFQGQRLLDVTGLSQLGDPSANSADQGMVEVWLRGVQRSQVEALGGKVGTEVLDILTARIPANKVDELVGLANLEQVQLARTMTPQCDVSIPETGANQAWDAIPPSFVGSGPTGAGVVIGIVDTGIDPTHPDLRTMTNKTRIKYLWDQTYTFVETPPAGFTYGTEYTAAQIDAGAYPTGDHLGHGTHMAGITTGNGLASAPTYTYVGVAPQADIVAVTLRMLTGGSVQDDKVIDGVNYVFQKAAQLGEPAVVLVAMSKMTGPHDGKDLADAAISALTGPGKIVVAPSGNYGSTGRHGELTSTANGQTKDVTLTFPAFAPSPVAQDFLLVEGWYNATANYSVSVVTPTGETVGPVARGSNTDVQTNSGRVSVSNGRFLSSNGSFRIDISVYRGSTTLPAIKEGTWTVRTVSQMSGSSTVDFWLTDYALGTAKPVFATGVTNRKLITSPATGDQVIAAGAYSTKRNWTDVNGSSRFYSLATVNEIAYFSGPGPRRDGAQAPHIAAPGYGVVAALSKDYLPSSAYVVPGGKHRMDYGTSVAAAHVAGAVALMLETDGSLTPAAVRSQLQQTARSDAWADSLPNAVWGFGKLHISPTTPVAVGDDPRSSFSVALSPASPNPMRGQTSFAFALSNDDLAKITRGVWLHIYDVRGRELAAIPGSQQVGQQRLTWNGTTHDGHVAAAGVYVARLQIGSRDESQRFVRLP